MIGGIGVGVGYFDVINVDGVDDVDAEGLIVVLKLSPPFLDSVGLDGVYAVSERDIFQMHIEYIGIFFTICQHLVTLFFSFLFLNTITPSNLTCFT